MTREVNLTLHPAATAAFNRKAEALIELLSAEAAPKEVASVVPPEAFISGRLATEDIDTDNTIKHYADVANRETAKFFYDKEDGWVGLEGGDFRQLIELSEEMQRRAELGLSLSSTFLEDQIFRWVKERYQKKATLGCVEYVLRAGEDAVADLIVWLPIPTLVTTVPFSVGRIEFRPITKAIIDAWQDKAQDKDRADEYFAALRRAVQGLAAATIRVIAEPVRAREIAFDEAERATAALRLFSPEILHPFGRSYWEPSGVIEPVGFDVLFTKGERLEGRHRWMSRDRVPHPALNAEKIRFLFAMGLSKVDALLRNEHRTSFQEDCLKALIQYSRAALKRDPAEKLLYIISALESIFVRDRQEGNIGKNLEERLGFFIRSDLKERLSLREKIRIVYGLRSDFVHSSLPITDLEVVKSFMVDAMAAFRNLLLTASAYNARGAFLADLDLHKLAGPNFSPHRFAPTSSTSAGK